MSVAELEALGRVLKDLRREILADVQREQRALRARVEHLESATGTTPKPRYLLPRASIRRVITS